MRNGRQWILLTLPVIGTVLMSGRACFAQNTNSGDLRGTATNSTGAIIPSVTVAVLDVDKGVSHVVVTDGAGLYDTGPIPEDNLFPGQ